jgi:S1-C subfamily serine protease
MVFRKNDTSTIAIVIVCLLVAVLSNILLPSISFSFLKRTDSKLNPNRNTHSTGSVNLTKETHPSSYNSTKGSAALTFTSGLTLSQLFNKVSGSVVDINILGNIFNKHILVNGSPETLVFGAEGSGFIYDQDGRIVTNYHVIAGGQIIYVRFIDGNAYSATVVGQDPYSDLAVLQVDPSALYREQIKPLHIGNSSFIQVGQPVVAIGSPAGLTGSVTQGIISQKNRVQLDISGRFWLGDMIQTDAAVTHGSSGGPLLDLMGNVVGVTEREIPSTTASSSSSASQLRLGEPGFNLAISSNTVQRIIPKLISDGSYKHAWLGVHVVDVIPIIAEQIGLAEAKGVIISSVTSGSPADKAGIKMVGNNSYYIIIGVDKRVIKDKSDLINYIESKVPGDNVILKVVRNNQIVHDITVSLGARPTLDQNLVGELATSERITSNNNILPQIN